MKQSFGTITPALLVMIGAFLVVVYGLILLLSLQLDYSNRRVTSQKALQIAEAGIEYYRWHLISDPGDYQDGTGAAGPYVHDYVDDTGQVVGTYTLNITPPDDSSSIITITSTGKSDDHPEIDRTIKVILGQQALTAFAFLHNSNIWFGQEVTINGPIFTNGGIRMDGTNTSTVKTSKATYICGVETGCTTPTEKPGIWGNGGPQELWDFPVIPIDFDSINIDFIDLRDAAQSVGLYLGSSGARGYHFVFKDTGSVDVYQVTTVTSYKGYSLENGCENLFQNIINETFLSNYSLSSLPVIFVEDEIWVEGTVNGSTTVVAARFPVDTDNADIWIPDNLVYLAKDGTNRLGLISQRDIIFMRNVPEDFEINGGLLAQSGRVIRHHYNWFKCSKTNQSQKKSLLIYGSVISNLRSYWNFSGGPKSPASGFVKSTISYDPDLQDTPPSYFPTSGGLRLIKWEEE